MEYHKILLGDDPYWLQYVKWSYPQHCHNEIELAYCMHGEVRITVEDKEYLLKEKDILCIDALAMHAYEMENDASVFVVEFGGQFIGKGYQEFAKKSFCFPHIASDSGNSYATAMRMLFKKFYDEFITPDEASTWAIRGCLNELFTLLVRSVPRSVIKNDRRQKQLERYARIHKVFDFVKNHYDEPITLSEAAGLVGYDPNAFCRLFKEITNSTFHQYLNSYRINLAMRLLANQNMSINEIAQQVGMSSTKMFGRVFKEHTGMSPREYKQCINKEAEVME
ncbi:MAG: helix-turn-helix transcriptional regulator [Clostridia bacterium]|nr:helix-turn-helix transcriptional regulator [Clostridia bacterium]